MQPRAPSGLFPASQRRPTFREPHPVRFHSVLAGAIFTALWLLLMSLLATSITGYIWLSLVAAALASAAAAVLVRYGDRGAAAGIAVVTSLGVSIAMITLAYSWVTSGWPLW